MGDFDLHGHERPRREPRDGGGGEIGAELGERLGRGRLGRERPKPTEQCQRGEEARSALLYAPILL